MWTSAVVAGALSCFGGAPGGRAAGGAAGRPRSGTRPGRSEGDHIISENQTAGGRLRKMLGNPNRRASNKPPVLMDPSKLGNAPSAAAHASCRPETAHTSRPRPQPRVERGDAARGPPGRDVAAPTELATRAREAAKDARFRSLGTVCVQMRRLGARRGPRRPGPVRTGLRRARRAGSPPGAFAGWGRRGLVSRARVARRSRGRLGWFPGWSPWEAPRRAP